MAKNIISKAEIEAKYPGVVLNGEPNPNLDWDFIAGFANVVAMAGSKVPAQKEQMFVYILRLGEEDIFKVGITKNIEERVKSMQTACHSELKVLRCVPHLLAKEIEGKILDSLKRYKCKGEWVKCKEATILRTFSKAFNVG
jgi:predicted GIY-YIG superfamily endonuclease